MKYLPVGRRGPAVARNPDQASMVTGDNLSRRYGQDARKVDSEIRKNVPYRDKEQCHD